MHFIFRNRRTSPAIAGFLAVVFAVYGSASVALAQTTSTQTTLAKIFTDHAVLQRDRPIPIWGTAKPGAEVMVRLGSLDARTTASDKGIWRVDIPAQEASLNPLALRVTCESDNLQRSDLLIGEVWHASGQSNMDMTVAAVAKSAPEVRNEIPSYDFPAIRSVRIQDGPSRQSLDELGATPAWTPCAPETVTTFSATAFFFAKQLHQTLSVPIGIIHSARGGTPIEPFIPRSAFTDHPTLIRELELGDQDDLAGIWRLPGGVRARNDNWLPGRLFHSRINPIKKYPVRGLIWYQGESNCGVAEDPRDYQHKMRALVRGWRDELSNPKLSVYFVQLPGSGAGPNWPYLREQQRLATDLPNVGMAVTIDLQHPNIHPPNKVDVGDRLARWALAHDYRRKIAFSGPVFRVASIDGPRVTVAFDHAESGLMIADKTGFAPVKETSDAKLNHFELADSDGNWRAADAVIYDDKIVVTSAHITKPVAVRYAYSVAPKNCNLFNRDNLPASPFCSLPEMLLCDPKLPE
ncbi:MAG: sialate O-acetylesterase [Pirellulaceae bacterium]|nr:sialate O-acetylesterase [Pirellulaceae bacterium]